MGLPSGQFPIEKITFGCSRWIHMRQDTINIHLQPIKKHEMMSSLYTLGHPEPERHFVCMRIHIGDNCMGKRELVVRGLIEFLMTRNNSDMYVDMHALECNGS